MLARRKSGSNEKSESITRAAILHTKMSNKRLSIQCFSFSVVFCVFINPSLTGLLKWKCYLYSTEWSLIILLETTASVDIHMCCIVD